MSRGRRMFNNASMLSNHQIESLVARIEPDLIALRRRIHEHPELAFEEHQTARAVSDYLSALDIPHRTGVGRTGVVAMIEGSARFADPGRTNASYYSHRIFRPGPLRVESDSSHKTQGRRNSAGFRLPAFAFCLDLQSKPNCRRGRRG